MVVRQWSDYFPWTEEGVGSNPTSHTTEGRKGVLIRLENGDVGNSDVQVRVLYLPPKHKDIL